MKKIIFGKTLPLIMALVLVFLCVPCTVFAEASDQSENEEPILKIACMADLHVDYNLQDRKIPQRPSTVAACEELKGQGYDIILLGGDLTSTNMGGKNGAWGEQVFNRYKKYTRTMLSDVTENGYVLYVAGNHDYQAGANAFNSANYTDIMLEDTGDFESALYSEDGRLLAYHYELLGFDFIGLNTPYVTWWPYVPTGYTEEQINWVSKTMAKIGKNKIVFLSMHYPFSDVNGATGGGIGSDSEEKLGAIFAKYPKLVVLYGHVHGGEDAYIVSKTSERITTHDSKGTPGLNSNPQGYVSAFMGSMGYYDYSLNPGGLGAPDPYIVQALTIEVFCDRIVFSMKNYGARDGGSREIEPFTVYTDAIKPQSKVYGIDYTEGVLSGLDNETNILTFVAKTGYGYDIGVYDEYGAPVDLTSTDRYMKAGMTVTFGANGTETARLRTVVGDQLKKTGVVYNVGGTSTSHTVYGNKLYAFDTPNALYWTGSDGTKYTDIGDAPCAEGAEYTAETVDIKLLEGAAMRFDGDEMMLRFELTVKKSDYDSVVEKYGKDNVSIGIMFEKNGKDASEYVSGGVVPDGDVYRFYGIVKADDKDESFAVKGFLRASDGENTYTATTSENTVRSLSQVAGMVIADVTDAESGSYKNKIPALGDKYSRYTEEQINKALSFVTSAE